MCVSQYTCLIVCAQPIAVETCKILGLGHNILVGHEELEVSSVQEMMADRTLKDKYGARCMESNGFAGVHPEHKYLIVQTFRQMGHLVGMCGDGVNDAPALKKADVGIAVSGAKAAAQKASDIVLTEPGLNTIVKAMVISRKIFTRMQNFVIYRVACTEQVNTAVPLHLYVPSACSFVLHPELLQSKQSNVTQPAILCLTAVALLLYCYVCLICVIGSYCSFSSFLAFATSQTNTCQAIGSPMEETHRTGQTTLPCQFWHS